MDGGLNDFYRGLLVAIDKSSRKLRERKGKKNFDDLGVVSKNSAFNTHDDLTSGSSSQRLKLREIMAEDRARQAKRWKTAFLILSAAVAGVFALFYAHVLDIAEIFGDVAGSVGNQKKLAMEAAHFASLGRAEFVGSLHNGKPVVAMTVLHHRVYVVREGSESIESHDSNGQLIQTLPIKGMDKVVILDMTASEVRNFLYLAEGGSVVIYRLSHGNLDPEWSQWETGCIPTGLSTVESRRGNVLVTCGDLNVIREYQPNGKLIRQVSLSSEVQSAFHAIELADNRFAVSHGDFYGLPGVCVVDTNEVLRWYGGTQSKLSAPRQMFLFNGFLIVADTGNQRVLALFPGLNGGRVLLKIASDVAMTHIALDDTVNGLLYVAWQSSGIGHISAYNLSSGLDWLPRV